MGAEVYIVGFIAYVVGSIVSLFIGRKWGINIGSVLTFELFMRLGYVKYHYNGQGEIVLEKVSAGSGD